MWKDYSLSYIKNNRSSGLSVMIAAFISALLLSLLCGLFYNAWKYEVERIRREEGGWQSRMVGEIDTKKIESIRNFANVKDVIVKEGSGEEQEVDLYFDHMKDALSDTPHMAELMGIPQEKITYNYQLLAMYLIRDEKDPAPRLLFPMYLVIMAIASFSLIVVIHNAFAVSMNARIHQFGIFSSIGATPRQIRACLLQEAAALSAVPVIAGNLLGIGASMGVVQLTNAMLEKVAPDRQRSVFGYHPLVLGITLAATAGTIWISAWLPAIKLSRLTPLEAMKNTGELQLRRRKRTGLLPLLLGVEGELAQAAMKAQQKALRTASLSLVFSFLAFAIMQCFFALSGISTRETYFEKYRNMWDIMVTVKDVGVETFEKTEEIQNLAGVESAVVYQRKSAKRLITEEEISEEMKGFGGFSRAPESYVTKTHGGWLVNAPLMILDDKSFLAYCEQIGVSPRLDGAVLLNQIRDVTNPDFRHPDFMPYIKADGAAETASTVLRAPGREEVMREIPVLSYTEKVPILREEYATLDYYELVHFIPVSLWKEISGQIEGEEEELSIRVLCRENVSLQELDGLQEQIEQLLSDKYAVECENRIREYELNDRQIQGMKTVLGGFCVLLGLIGIGNVFSNTLGFVRQRKREFARYMSVGLTPEEIKKMFCIEALILAGRPILIALPLAVIAVGTMLRLSYVAVGEFAAQAPFLPIGIFILAIVCFVALAYALAWRSVREINLAEVLRDDTMM